MKRKELNKTFMMFSNKKKSLVSMVYAKIYFIVVRVNTSLLLGPIPEITKHLYNIYTTSIRRCINVIQMFCDCFDTWVFHEIRAHILVQVTIHRRLLIGRDGHLYSP